MMLVVAFLSSVTVTEYAWAYSKETLRPVATTESRFAEELEEEFAKQVADQPGEDARATIFGVRESHLWPHDAPLETWTYRDKESNYNRDFATLNATYDGALSRAIEDAPGTAKVLAIGIGLGYEIFEPMKQYGDRVDITSTSKYFLLETDPAALRAWFLDKKGIAISLTEAEELIRKVRTKYYKCELARDRLPGREYDIVVFGTAVLRWIKNTDRFESIEEALRVCKTGGKLFADMRFAFLFDVPKSISRKRFMTANEFFQRLDDRLPNFEATGDGVCIDKTEGFTFSQFGYLSSQVNKSYALAAPFITLHPQYCKAPSEGDTTLESAVPSQADSVLPRFAEQDLSGVEGEVSEPVEGQVGDETNEDRAAPVSKAQSQVLPEEPVITPYEGEIIDLPNTGVIVVITGYHSSEKLWGQIVREQFEKHITDRGRKVRFLEIQNDEVKTGVASPHSDKETRDFLRQLEAEGIQVEAIIDVHCAPDLYYSSGMPTEEAEDIILVLMPNEHSTIQAKDALSGIGIARRGLSAPEPVRFYKDGSALVNYAPPLNSLIEKNPLSRDVPLVLIDPRLPSPSGGLRDYARNDGVLTSGLQKAVNSSLKFITRFSNLVLENSSSTVIPESPIGTPERNSACFAETTNINTLTAELNAPRGEFGSLANLASTSLNKSQKLELVFSSRFTETGLISNEDIQGICKRFRAGGMTNLQVSIGEARMTADPGRRRLYFISIDEIDSFQPHNVLEDTALAITPLTHRNQLALLPRLMLAGLGLLSLDPYEVEEGVENPKVRAVLALLQKVNPNISLKHLKTLVYHPTLDILRATLHEIVTTLPGVDAVDFERRFKELLDAVGQLIRDV